jgi:hypothetical protein
MITFQEEKSQPFLNEAIQLFKDHYEELAERPDVIKFKPNFKMYFKAYNAGKIVIHTVRDDGKLVGYNVWMMIHYAHATDGLTANSDIIYLSPNYRKGFLGFNFLRWTIETIKNKNPQRIVTHTKPSLDYGPLLERLGAELYEKSYMIVLE